MTGLNGPGFSYQPSWLETKGAFPISVRMPLQADLFPPAIVFPWLQNLLPENEILVTIGRIIGTAPGDVLGMLQRMGRDIAGALTIGNPPEGQETQGYRPIPDERALERIVEELPARPFLVGEQDVSMSLAGAQEKLPVAMHDGHIAIPVHGAPSTHILKPDNPRLSGSVQNEALSLVLADLLGLNPTLMKVAGPFDAYTFARFSRVSNRTDNTSPQHVTTGRAGGRSYLLVKRYDRGEGGRRIHQEDFCQALGRPPSAKYQHNQTGTPGPSLHDFFELTRHYMTGSDILRLLDAVIFNVLIGNVDSHAKNYSLVITAGGFSLAPLYDVMCGAAWDGITLNHAQTIGHQRRGKHIQRRDWIRMAQDCGLSPSGVVRRVIRLTDAVLNRLDPAIEIVRAMPAGDDPVLNTVRDEVRKLCVAVRRNAERTGETE